jgi:hypothetical protein
MREVRPLYSVQRSVGTRLRLKCDGTCAETRFRLSAKRTSPFKSAWGGGGGSVQSTTGRRAVHISLQGLYRSCARASLCSAVMWRLLVTHSILLFPLHFSTRASPCAITFQTQSTYLALQRVLSMRSRPTPKVNRNTSAVLWNSNVTKYSSTFLCKRQTCLWHDLHAPSASFTRTHRTPPTMSRPQLWSWITIGAS